MSEMLRTGWTWYPSVIIGFSIWSAAYILAIYKNRMTTLSQQIAFHSGTVIALLALLSPLDKLGDDYLFSAHMI